MPETTNERRSIVTIQVGIAEICLVIIAVCVVIALFAGWDAV